jgi:hypothetical protein
MSDDSKWLDGLKVLTAAGLLLAGVAACDGELLDVEDPDNVQPEEQLSPENVAPRLAGMINEFRSAYDDYVLYTGLLTDEFILAGTFPTRREIDQRNPISQNVSINADVWEPLSVTRAVADQNIAEFESALGTEQFAGQTANLQTGIAWGNLIAGYSRLFLAEMFCHSILGGGSADLPRFVDDENVEEAPLGTAERARDALDFFEEAEAVAGPSQFDIPEVRLAALVGQARSHMLLHSLGSTTEDHLAAADAAASEVWDSNPRFVSAIEYSISSTAEENDVFQTTWGVNSSLRWTVGEGSDASRGNETFAYLGQPAIPDDPETTEDESEDATYWFGQGLVIEPGVAAANGLAAFNGVSPVVPQTLYAGRSGGQRDISIPLATAWEARMIQAEVALRGGSPGAAEGMANPLLTNDEGQNPMASVNSGLTATPGPGALTQESLGDFDELTLDGSSPAENLAHLARAYEAGLWLTSHRHHYLRRMAEEFDDRFFPRNAVGTTYGQDRDFATANGSLWPDHAFPTDNPDAGDAITLPVPVNEVDNNTNISSACPAGYP